MESNNSQLSTSGTFNSELTDEKWYIKYKWYIIIAIIVLIVIIIIIIVTSNKCADNCNGNGACDKKTGKCTCLIEKVCIDDEKDRCKTCKL